MKGTSAYFVSDAHLGIPLNGSCDREAALLDFFAAIAGDARYLFIVGDLFDFWVEYGNTIRADYYRTLCGLSRLIGNGTEVHYLAGNHDFALGPFLSRTMGIRVHPGELDIEMQGRKLHLYHGDGILKIDVGYRILKPILRNRFNQRLYKLLHPSIGIALAARCSAASRHYTHGRLTEERKAEYRAAAFDRLRHGRDIVVFGHTHCPEICVSEGKTYCNTGGWLHECNYAVLTDGAMSLWRYVCGGTPQQIQPRPPK